MKRNSILIVFSDKKLAEITSKKINLLRRSDEVTFVSYAEINKIENKIIPSIIMVCHNPSESLSIIDKIKTIFKQKTPPIILVTEHVVEDILIDAFEKEIDDFFSINDSEPIILMRILNTIKKSKLQQKFNTNKDILIEEKYIDAQTEIYKKEAAESILSLLFNKTIKNNIENNVFLRLTLQKEDNNEINLEKIAVVLKNTLRETDIITYGNNNNFNLFLENIDEENTIKLINKINCNLNKKYLIYYTAVRITKDYKETIKIVEPLTNIQYTDKEYFVFLNDVEQIALYDMIQIQRQKENISKTEFVKNIDSIVAPVYYQMQTKYSERFKKAEINFCINNSENKFSIKKDGILNELSITYPTKDNIIIDVKESSNNNIIKERNITYHREDFNEDKLTNEIETMIKDFVEIDSINTINKETYETK